MNICNIRHQMWQKLLLSRSPYSSKRSSGINQSDPFKTSIIRLLKSNVPTFVFVCLFVFPEEMAKFFHRHRKSQIQNLVTSLTPSPPSPTSICPATHITFLAFSSKPHVILMQDFCTGCLLSEMLYLQISIRPICSPLITLCLNVVFFKKATPIILPPSLSQTILLMHDCRTKSCRYLTYTI